jgi:uncharacterized repeat protein (TIGR01451 family)
MLAFGASSASAFEGPTADFGATVSGPDGTTADSDVAYSITVVNGGPDAAEEAALNDVVPAGTTFVSLSQDSGPAFSCTTPAGTSGPVSCTVATLASGASAAFTLTVHVAPGTPGGSYVTDTATASTTSFDPNSENDTSTTSTLVGPVVNADMSVSQTPLDGALPGANVTYSVTVANNGPDAADATLTDLLPDPTTFVSLAQTTGPAFTCSTPAVGAGGTVSCSVASIPSGAHATFTLVVNVPSATESGTWLTNFATVGTSVHDATSENDESSTSTLVASADLSVTESGPSRGVVRGTLTYSITVSNAGPDIAGSVVLTDVVPMRTTLVSFTQMSGPAFGLSMPVAGGTGTVTASTGSLGPGASAAFTLVVRIDPVTSGRIMITNIAKIASLTADPNRANNSFRRSAMVRR